MNLHDRNKLLIDLIRVNPDSRIKDYCRIVKRLEGRNVQTIPLEDVRFYSMMEEDVQDLLRLYPGIKRTFLNR